MGNQQLTLGSLFDGSGAFPLGGVLSGIIPVWNSEIEPFPVLVTHRRMPGVKHYGDVSKIIRSRSAAGGYHHLSAVRVRICQSPASVPEFMTVIGRACSFRRSASSKK